MALTDEARQICEKAFAAIDKVDADQAEWERRRQAESLDQRCEREAQEAESYLAYLGRREPPQVRAKPERRRTAAMDAALKPTVDVADKEWVRARLDAFASIMGEEVAKTQNEIVKKLRAEIADLRAEVESLRAQNVTPMRSRHVA